MRPGANSDPAKTISVPPVASCQGRDKKSAHHEVNGVKVTAKKIKPVINRTRRAMSCSLRTQLNLGGWRGLPVHAAFDEVNHRQATGLNGFDIPDRRLLRHDERVGPI